MIVSCTSLTDAVILSHSTKYVSSVRQSSISGANNGLSTTYLAAYIFGSSDAANFMSQNLNSHVAWINQIPSSLLSRVFPTAFEPALLLSITNNITVGPAAPINYASPNSTHRYDTKVFSVPRLQCIQSPKCESLSMVSKLLENSEAAAIEHNRGQPMKALKSSKQPAGHAIGFFEQGILIGTGITLSIVIPIFAYGSYFIGQKCLQFVKRNL